ncbi:MAG: hypothetical protein ACR2KT_04535 [Methylocella sp.]
MTKDWTDIFNRYHGMWLAFDEDEKTVLAAARTAKQALSEAIAKGFPTPLLYRVPDTLRRI